MKQQTTRLFKQVTLGGQVDAESGGHIERNTQVTHIGSQKQSAGPHIDALLTVSGKIVAQSCYIRLQNWADFVFDTNYKLMGLKELKKFYTANHHLPNVPTEKEIMEKGNDLGQTDAILLQKTEENTLYIVELNEKLEEQAKIIAELKKELDSLKRNPKN